MTAIIGLTGGIGSGKTTVAEMFEQLGIPVFIADNEGTKVMKSTTALESVRQTFGDEVFDGNLLNRKKLAAIVFNDPKKLQKLNNIVHPLVALNFEKWLKQHSDKLFVIRESAILFESGTWHDCQKIITVTAPLEIRIQRVIDRGMTDAPTVKKRIENQWADSFKIAKSDFVIHNLSLADTRLQVYKIYSELTKKQ